MDNEEVISSRKKDLGYSWVSTSRFLFYCQLAIFVAFLIGATYALYAHRYKGKPQVEVPANTHFNPTYK